MPFTKMQGIGNDYIYVDCTEKQYFRAGEASVFSKKFSDRHFGIGSDGVILICASETADFRMEMYNADGSLGKMCGNGIRCLARYVSDRKRTSKKVIRVETLSGIREIETEIDSSGGFSASVNMGKPSFAARDIPVIREGDTMINEPIHAAGTLYNVTAVSMGNPHAVIFTKDIEKLEIERIGPIFEKHRLFPEGVNTEFAEIYDRKRIRMRVWERGSGETMACGTGACATVAAAVENDLSDREVTVILNGGALDISWNEKTGEIVMVGPAEFVFDGEVLFDPKKDQ
ncbi:MAG: diaminopimelate epimerase [Clostridiales bacterium]|nr:diaminopimelate epimerase [Clostridiales bacterium]